MPTPDSWSKFLIQPAADFLASAGDDALTQRLVPAFASAGITDVCSITRTTRDDLAAQGASDEDIRRLRDHLAYYDLTLRGNLRELGLARALV